MLSRVARSVTKMAPANAKVLMNATRSFGTTSVKLAKPYNPDNYITVADTPLPDFYRYDPNFAYDGPMKDDAEIDSKVWGLDDDTHLVNPYTAMLALLGVFAGLYGIAQISYLVKDKDAIVVPPPEIPPEIIAGTYASDYFNRRPRDLY
eukprot:TRINITY_DN2808_c1_g1_i1.p1 TRINITY_DN2808_c1_g1~~TRINITY_DN2808_c1_g1_i1.p1  ORF type:complete len:168 (+),score=76.89 TRINITY_DN2808_c1_g1_i1:59-505(+)